MSLTNNLIETQLLVSEPIQQTKTLEKQQEKLPENEQTKTLENEQKLPQNEQEKLLENDLQKLPENDLEKLPETKQEKFTDYLEKLPGNYLEKLPENKQETFTDYLEKLPENDLEKLLENKQGDYLEKLPENKLGTFTNYLEKLPENKQQTLLQNEKLPENKQETFTDYLEKLPENFPQQLPISNEQIIPQLQHISNDQIITNTPESKQENLPEFTPQLPINKLEPVKEKKRQISPDFEFKIGSLTLHPISSGNFDDDNKIYERKIGIYSNISDGKETTVSTFLTELFFLTELGKRHIFNFLMDIPTIDKVKENMEIILFLCYKKYFVLWLSPSLANKMIDKQKGKYFIRTSTSVSGNYTFSFNENGALLHYRVSCEMLKDTIKSFNEKMNPIIVNPMLTHRNHYGYI